MTTSRPTSKYEAKVIALEEALRRAKAADRAKADFLANMSHELTTPLNSIIGFSQVLKDELYGSLNPKQKEYVTDILESGNHLLAIMNSVMAMVQLDPANATLIASRFQLRDILTTSFLTFKRLATNFSLKLSLDIAQEADIEIFADSDKLQQALFHLLDNALKFTPAGGRVRLTARLPAPPSSADGKGHIEIAVEDTGIGIHAEDMNKLFLEFVQTESPYVKKFSGIGMGLALTRRLVEIQGGRIWAESEFGKGSRFAFTIPLSK